jgi:hypothetical protein
MWTIGQDVASVGQDTFVVVDATLHHGFAMEG